MLETGYCFRVERDGKWLNLDITELTEEELSNILKTKDEIWLENLIIGLIGKIAQIDRFFDDFSNWDKI